MTSQGLAVEICGFLDVPFRDPGTAGFQGLDSTLAGAAPGADDEGIRQPFSGPGQFSDFTCDLTGSRKALQIRDRSGHSLFARQVAPQCERGADPACPVTEGDKTASGGIGQKFEVVENAAAAREPADLLFPAVLVLVDMGEMDHAMGKAGRFRRQFLQPENDSVRFGIDPTARRNDPAPPPLVITVFEDALAAQFDIDRPSFRDQLSGMPRNDGRPALGGSVFVSQVQFQRCWLPENDADQSFHERRLCAIPVRAAHAVGAPDNKIIDCRALQFYIL